MKVLRVLEDGYVRGNSKAGQEIPADHMSDKDIEALVTAGKAELLTIGTVDTSAAQAEIAQLKADFEKLPKSTKEAQARIASLEAENAALREQLAKLQPQG